MLGPGAPVENGSVYGKGIYCKNYKEIIEKQKVAKEAANKKQSER